tara:strand:- start:1422 stop:1703 length:282 start_codon:yes stop_codon:yes gene_type:complete
MSDDSFILKEHKDVLVNLVNQRITKNPDYESLDNVMLEVLCLDMYHKVVNGIDKEQYFRELEQSDENKNLFKKPDNLHIKGAVIENIDPPALS